MTDVDIIVPQEVVDPETGELIPRSDPAACGGLIERLRQLEHRLRTLKAWANDAILEQMDAEAQWTLHAGGLKLSAPSPTAGDVVWDLDELAKLQDHLSPERYGELVRQVVTYEPQTAKLRNAAKAGGDIERIITQAQTLKPKRRYVSVGHS